MGVEVVSGSRSVLLPSLRTNGGSEGGLFCGNAGAGGWGLAEWVRSSRVRGFPPPRE